MIRRLTSIDWDSKTVRILDWGLAAASFAVYFWTGHWAWLAGAILGAISAWYRPMSRVQNLINRIVVRRRSA